MTWRNPSSLYAHRPPFALVAPECCSPIERFSEIGLFFACDLVVCHKPVGAKLAREDGVTVNRD
ncbi:hypothetical protein, partial [Pseudomonas sp. BF-R-01]|uniref:hypothetical protein n=1 Tax=Pseudomonas sp. BF-R-01 TaxID=2832365 RepID=UPI001CBAEEB4